MQPFAGVVDLRGFVWGDFDGDGDPDAALLDAQGVLHVFENRQAGEFREMPRPADARPAGGAGRRRHQRRRRARHRDARRRRVDSARVPQGRRVGAAADRRRGRTIFRRRRRGNVSAVSRRSRQQRRARSRGVGRRALSRLARRAAPVRFEPLPSAAGWRGVRHPRSEQRWPARSGWPAERIAGPDAVSRHGGVSLAGDSTARAADGRRSAHQLVRHRRRHRDSIRPADAEAGDHRVAGAFRSGDAHRRRGHADRLAERHHAGRLRSPRRRSDRGRAASEGILSLGVRRRWDGHAVRDRLPVAIAARPSHQRAGHGRRDPDRRLGEDSRRSAGGEERSLRCPDHRRAVGNALHRSRVVDGRGSSGRHRCLRGRAIRAEPRRP